MVRGKKWVVAALATLAFSLAGCAQQNCCGKCQTGHKMAACCKCCTKGCACCSDGQCGECCKTGSCARTN